MLIPILLLGLAAVPLSAAPLTVWVEDRVRLDRAARAAFETELRALLEARNLAIHYVAEPGPDAVQVALHRNPPAARPRTLGHTYCADSRVLPQIEVFLYPVLRMLGGASWPETLGRALARVAAHEVLHYATQRTDHDRDGLFQPGLTAHALADVD